MTNLKLKIKVAFVEGLKDVVLKEIKQYPKLHIISENKDSLLLDFTQDFSSILNLKSVTRAYLVSQDSKYNPSYISKHKSILSNIINTVIDKNKDKFKSFKITCAGGDSTEVRNISEYIQAEHKLVEKEEADIKIHIVKLKDTWEVGAQMTSRPLSLRDYKVEHMSGAMDPTIAYAVNSLCRLGDKSSYLNIFSGSATLLIEAGLIYPNLKPMVGFDNNKKHISLAIQNIKKAGLIKRIQLNEKNIFDKPNLGKFDVITSDLPFGMVISKNENLEDLYQCFIDYCEETLNGSGILVVYTSEHQILEKIILKSKFEIIETLELKFITKVDAYLKPKIFMCRFR